MGSVWVDENAVELEFGNHISLATITQNLRQYICGSITLALIAAIAFGVFTFILLKLLKRKQAPAL